MKLPGSCPAPPQVTRQLRGGTSTVGASPAWDPSLIRGFVGVRWATTDNSMLAAVVHAGAWLRGGECKYLLVSTRACGAAIRLAAQLRC
jgi:hypothetical protein